jgi:DNA mismatch repair ATPase MutS
VSDLGVITNSLPHDEHVEDSLKSEHALCLATRPRHRLSKAEHVMNSNSLPNGYHREASPGKLTAFEEELFHNVEMSEVPVVMAVTTALVEGHNMVGMAYCDASRRHLGACEFADDEHYCSLESLIIQLGAKEIVLPRVRFNVVPVDVCFSIPFS